MSAKEYAHMYVCMYIHTYAYVYHMYIYLQEITILLAVHTYMQINLAFLHILRNFWLFIKYNVVFVLSYGRLTEINIFYCLVF